MSTSQNVIQKRQTFFWEGRGHEEEGNLIEAIEAYKIYSTFLAEADKHIPQQWIARLYERLGEVEKALFYFENYAAGCSPPLAAELFKEIGERYLAINNTEKALEFFQLAVQKNPKIGLRKKIDKLKGKIE